MTEQKQRKLLHPLTLEEALDLVDFELVEGEWRVKYVKCNVEGSVYGNVGGDVMGNVEGSVKGNVWGSVWGDIQTNLWGTIKGRKWQLIETPKEKLKRLVEEGVDTKSLLEAIDQLEDGQ